MRTTTTLIGAAVLAASATLTGASDHHGEHEGHAEREHEERHGGHRRRPAPAPSAEQALYVKECGACHLAYPPAFLPPASWSRLLGGLERHFGQNAELEPDVRDPIERWLRERAAEPTRGERARPAGEGPLRITELAWFRREHREIGPEVRERPSVRTLSNCASCHPGATRWDFDEDRVMIPSR